MSNVVTESLTAKVGPLPAWAWGLALGGTIVGVRWYRNRDTGSGSVDLEAGTSADGSAESGMAEAGGAGIGIGMPGVGISSGGGVVGSYPVPSSYQANPGGVITSDGSDSGSVDSGPMNNGEWRTQAFDALRARQYGTTQASTALSKYLSSSPLTAAEEGMIAYVLQEVGEPPEGAPAIVREGAQATTPTAPPAPAPVTPPIAAPPAPWVKPPWLGATKFVIGENGGAVYLVTERGLSHVPNEATFYANGGGGTVQLASGPYTYGGNPTGTPPLPVPQAWLDAAPKV